MVKDMDGTPREWLKDFAAKAITTLQRQADECLAETLSQDDADDVADAYSDAYLVLAEPVQEGEEWALRKALELVEENPDDVPRDLWKRVAVIALRAIKSMRFDVHSPDSGAIAESTVAGSTSLGTAAVSALQGQLKDLQHRIDRQGKARQGRTLESALESYVSLKVQKRDWPSADHHAATKMRRFVEIIGADREVESVNSEEIAQFLGTLTSERGGSPAAIGTKTLYFQTLNAFFREAVRQEWTTRNPAEGMKPRAAVAPHESTLPWTDAELRKIFNVELIEAASGSVGGQGATRPRPERLWVPLLELLQGMRITEAAQLHLEDILEVDGVHCVRVYSDEDPRTGKRGVRIAKNRASIRTMPMHRTLIDLGFLTFVQQRRSAASNDPNAPLFAELTRSAEGRMSTQVVQWFGGSRGFFARIGVRAPGKKSHSFRGTFSTKLERARVPDVARAALEGHARTGDVGAKVYVGAYTVAELKVELDRIDWDEPLSDLRRLLGKA